MKTTNMREIAQPQQVLDLLAQIYRIVPNVRAMLTNGPLSYKVYLYQGDTFIKSYNFRNPMVGEVLAKKTAFIKDAARFIKEVK